MTERIVYCDYPVEKLISGVSVNNNHSQESLDLWKSIPAFEFNQIPQTDGPQFGEQCIVELTRNGDYELPPVHFTLPKLQMDDVTIKKRTIDLDDSDNPLKKQCIDTLSIQRDGNVYSETKLVEIPPPLAPEFVATKTDAISTWIITKTEICINGTPLA
jgi:hypothetical protein